MLKIQCYCCQRMEPTMNKYSLYIPRVALSSSSSSSKSSKRHENFAQNFSNTKGEVSETSGESESEGIYGSTFHRYDKDSETNRNQIYLVHKAPKHGSQSTQSSSLSSSSKSNFSMNLGVNSLLLSVKNLEEFNKMSTLSHQIYNKNERNNFQSNYEQKRQMLENIRTILSIDEFSVKDADEKVKDSDELSTASSITTTNFTVVTFNGFNKKPIKSKSICRRSHQVTIVIIVMSLLLFFLISGLVCMLEMRYQKMPR
ncbi:CLUMA_CG011153, isoform A [Clunio marinus]|uniref:CLUMA_CG011153, isoform A n=1 Tax=Clunio marinus TaxID=568069 RepID=A0A1J1IFJ1_9DIPT|nr:CLUMA_CG011153, isoform A [Clunio marinus]